MSQNFLAAYRLLIAFGKSLRSPLLLILRLYFGITWFLTGIGKLGDIGSFVNYLEFLNVPLPTLNAYFVACIETFGGLLLAMGLLSRLVCIPLIVIMVVAYLTADSESAWQIFSNPQLFISRSPFNYLLTALLVLAFGPGKISIDYLIKKYIQSKETKASE